MNFLSVFFSFADQFLILIFLFFFFFIPVLVNQLNLMCINYFNLFFCDLLLSVLSVWIVLLA